MPYRGQDFVGVHDETVGDGQAVTRPRDTWYDNRNWGNMMFLAGEPRLITWSPHIDNADVREGAGSQSGVRPFALLNDFIAVWTAEVWVEPGQSGIRFYICANIFTITSQEFNLEFELEIGDLGLATGAFRQGFDGSQDAKISRDVIDITFPRPYVANVPRKYWMQLRIRSVFTDDLNAASSTSFVAGRELKDTTSFFTDSVVGNPDADSLEVQVVEFVYDNDVSQKLDMLGVDDLAYKGGTGSVVYTVQELPGYDDNGARASSLKEITWFAPRAISYQPKFDRTSIERMSQRALNPNIDVNSSPAMRQAMAANKIHRRSRIVLMGGRGDFPASGVRYTTYTAKNYRICWPFVEGADPTKTLIQETFYVTSENPRLQLMIWFLCLNHDLMTTINVNTISSKRINGKEQIEEVEGFGKAAWDFQLTVDQMDDLVAGGAAWDTNSTQSETLQVDEVLQLMPAGRFNTVPPCSRGLEHNWQNFNFYHKEGGLIPNMGDELWVQPLVIKMRLAGLDSTETARPMRLKLTARHVAETHSFAWDNEVGGAQTEGELLTYVLAGETHFARAVEHPDAGSGSGTITIRVTPGYDPPVNNTTITGQTTGRTIDVDGAVSELAVSRANDYLREDRTGAITGPEARVSLYLGNYTMYEFPQEPGS